MTTEEKMELANTHARDSKLIENYVASKQKWIDKVSDTCAFEESVYKVKPQNRDKFNIGDKLVNKEAEGEENPIRFELTSIIDEAVKLDDCWDCSLKELYEQYIHIEDVLWYFEKYNCITKSWKLITFSRFTLSEADNLFTSSCNITKWRPMYALGFTLNENE